MSFEHRTSAEKKNSFVILNFFKILLFIVKRKFVFIVYCLFVDF